MDYVTEDYELLLGDCVQRLEELGEDSVDLIITSPPFAQAFSYTQAEADVGNCNRGDDEFWLHMAFVFRQLLRVLKPGRFTCLHVADHLALDVLDGYMGIRFFAWPLAQAAQRAGFEPKAVQTIPKNPRAIARRMHLHSLMFVNLRGDEDRLGGMGDKAGKRRKGNTYVLWPARNDYLLVFGKPGRPESAGDNVLNAIDEGTWAEWASGVWPHPDEIENLDAREIGELVGRRVAGALEAQKAGGGWGADDLSRLLSGVWDDVRETDVLPGYHDAREPGDCKHVCPLQLGLVERCIRLWSMPGDVVLDPFDGVGSVVHEAVRLGRVGIGVELKERYHEMAALNAQRAVMKRGQLAMAL
jgi:DNA modification methylase